MTVLPPFVRQGACQDIDIEALYLQIISFTSRRHETSLSCSLVVFSLFNDWVYKFTYSRRNRRLPPRRTNGIEPLQGHQTFVAKYAHSLEGRLFL